MEGLIGRQLLSPECAPIKGPRWVYPVGASGQGPAEHRREHQEQPLRGVRDQLRLQEGRAWIKKLSMLTIPIRHNGNVTVLKGPKGYYCSAWPDTNGLAYAGGCQSNGGGGCVASRTTTARSTRRARAARSRVATRPSAGTGTSPTAASSSRTTANGVLHLIHVSGADTNVVFRYLNGGYQLAGPEHERHRLSRRLHLGAVARLDGHEDQERERRDLQRAPGGEDPCVGPVQPPSCLCTGDGGVGHRHVHARRLPPRPSGYLFGGSPWQFKVTKMTPVPYIIPGTPDEAQKRSGV